MKTKTNMCGSSLLTCKTRSRFATLNIRTLSDNLHELINLSDEYGLDVLCIQEHRLYHDDVELKFHYPGENWTLITSSATNNLRNASVGGVGLLISPCASRSLNNVQKINSRVLKATFKGNPETTIICCYSPTNVDDMTKREEFYDELNGVVKAIPKHHILLIGGDFNAKLGRNEKLLTYNKQTNDNGLLLMEMMSENKLTALNCSFQKRHGKLWTHRYPNGEKTQLDYILLNSKWRNSATNCEAYSTFGVLGSDHRIVTAELRVSLRANKTPMRKSKYDWEKLLTDTEICKEYSISVRNSFAALADLDANTDCDTLYSSLVTAHEHAAEETLPLKPKKKKHVAWLDANVQKKQQAVKSAHATQLANPTENNKSNLKAAKDELQEAYI